jgi:hypothetical protein
VIDPELVTRKTLLILRDLDALKPIAAKDLASYLATPLDEVVVERPSAAHGASGQGLGEGT